MTPLLPAVSRTGAPLLDVIHCVDALELLRALPDGCVDAVITDPPYGTQKAAWDDFISPDVFRECLRVTKSWAVFFYANAHLWHILGIIHDLGYGAWVAVWSKTNSMERAYKYFPQWTPIVCVYKSGAPFFGQDLITQAIVTHNGIEHPTIKPLPLIEKIIMKTTRPGDVILDPFVGSGTTALAARNTGRHYICGDSSPEYVAIAKKRLAQPFTPSFLDTVAPGESQEKHVQSELFMEVK